MPTWCYLPENSGQKISSQEGVKRLLSTWNALRHSLRGETYHRTALAKLKSVFVAIFTSTRYLKNFRQLQPAAVLLNIRLCSLFVLTCPSHFPMSAGEPSTWLDVPSD